MIKYLLILILLNINLLYSGNKLDFNNQISFDTYFGSKKEPIVSFIKIPLINNTNEQIYLISNFIAFQHTYKLIYSLESGTTKALDNPVKLQFHDTFNIELFVIADKSVKDTITIYFETSQIYSLLNLRDSIKVYINSNKTLEIKSEYYFQEQYKYPFEIDEKLFWYFNSKIFNYTDNIEILSVDSLKNKNFEFLGFADSDSHPSIINLNTPFIISNNDFKFACFKVWSSSFGLSNDSLKVRFRNTKTNLIDSTYITLYMNIIEKKDLEIYKNTFIHNSKTGIKTKYPFSVFVTNRFPKNIKIIKLSYQEPLELGSLDIKMFNKELPVIIKPNEVDTIEIDFTPKELGQKVGRVNIEYELNGLTQYQFIYIVTQNDSKTNIESIKENPLAFYPNPVNTLATLLLDEEPSVGEQVGIYNSLGTLVKTLGVSDKYTQVNTEDFAEGVYIARLLWSGKSVKFCVVR